MSEDALSALAASYGSIAPEYGELWAPVLRPFTLRLLDDVSFDGARHVLDLGTGVGTMLRDLASRAPEGHVVGMDLSEGMLRLADARYGRVLADATRPPFVAASFDVVVSAFVLFNVPAPAAAFTAARSSLVPGGTFAMTTWGDPDDALDPPAYGVFVEELDAAGAGPDPVEATASSRKELGTPDRLSDLLSSAGFVNVRTEAVPFVHSLDADGYVRERAWLGPTRRRLESLDPGAREACLAKARARIAALTPEDRTDHDTVVMGWARAPR